jgi:protein O-GlcNAc transferase
MPSPDPRLIAALDAHRAGRFAEAETGYRAALAADPAQAGALHLLGVLLHQTGRSAAGAETIARAIALKDDVPDFHSNYGLALLGADDPGGAEVAFRRALALDPSRPAFHHNLGQALDAQGRADEAATAWRAALARDADFAPSLNNLAAALVEAGNPAQAEPLLRRAIAAAPEDPAPHVTLGKALRDLGRSVEAETLYARAAEIAPDTPDPWLGQGTSLAARGRVVEAVERYRRALAADPDDPLVWDNLLYAFNYDDTRPRAEIAAAYRDWNARLRAKLGAPAILVRRPGSAPRIGYVSADFRAHSCAHVLEAVLKRHRAEIHAFANVALPDATTARLRGMVSKWHDIARLDDDAAAAAIRAAGIDLLIDLSGHTAGNRLGVFARRAAPLQATWLGYPATTGLDAMDARIVDAVTDPDDSGMTERPVRVPGGFLAFAPPDAALPPPKSEAPVFGSFNNLAKLSDTTLALWARILRETPGSRFLLKARGLDEPATRAEFAARFAAHGIAPERLEIVGFVDRHLDLYGRMDVALDPLPYSGTITTFEALWMGVPVVTRPGATHAARVGASILTYGGFAEWIARDADEYVAIAKRLAANKPPRDVVRATLSASPLFDAARLARAIEGLASS